MRFSLMKLARSSFWKEVVEVWCGWVISGGMIVTSENAYVENFYLVKCRSAIWISKFIIQFTVVFEFSWEKLFFPPKNQNELLEFVFSEKLFWDGVEFGARGPLDIFYLFLDKISERIVNLPHG